MKRKHPHHKSDELHIFIIPVNPEHPMGLKVIPNDGQAMAREVGGEFIHVIYDESLPILECGCPMVMVVNYDSQDHEDNFLPNSRASCFFDGEDKILGDAFLMGQGMVKDEWSRVQADFISLTPEFHDWQGFGHPVPQSKKPWEE